MSPEDAYLLWKTGEIASPPAEHIEYCRRRATEDAKRLKPRLVISNPVDGNDSGKPDGNPMKTASRH